MQNREGARSAARAQSDHARTEPEAAAGKATDERGGTPDLLAQIDLCAHISERAEALAASAGEAGLEMLAHVLKVASLQAEQDCEARIRRAYEIARLASTLQDDGQDDGQADERGGD